MLSIDYNETLTFDEYAFETLSNYYDWKTITFSEDAEEEQFESALWEFLEEHCGLSDSAAQDIMMYHFDEIKEWYENEARKHINKNLT